MHHSLSPLLDGAHPTIAVGSSCLQSPVRIDAPVSARRCTWHLRGLRATTRRRIGYEYRDGREGRSSLANVRNVENFACTSCVFVGRRRSADRSVESQGEERCSKSMNDEVTEVGLGELSRSTAVGVTLRQSQGVTPYSRRHCAGALRCLRGDRWRVCDRFWTTVDARRGTRLPPLSLPVVRYAGLGDTGTVPIHCIQVTGGGPAEARGGGR